MVDYEREEMSLQAIADAFYKVRNEYEHLCSIIPHKSKAQDANIISRLPIIPFVGKEVKKEFKTDVKMELGKSEPVATVTRTMTIPVQMSTSEVAIPSEQKRTAVAQTTPRTPSVVELDTVPEEEVNIEKDAEASKSPRRLKMRQKDQEQSWKRLTSTTNMNSQAVEKLLTKGQ